MHDVKKLGNPAVVGLAGFGLTTLLLQLNALGLCAMGPVLAMGLIFGGLCQMIAGFQEQKMGNNFGYCAFVSYGAFWIGFCIILICKKLDFYPSNHHDIGWFLIVWTGFTAILWVGSLMIHKAMAYVLIACALGAWYMMAAIVLNDLAGRVLLPVGAPILKKPAPKPEPAPRVPASAVGALA